MKRFFTSLTFKIGFIIILVEIVILTATGFIYIRQFTNQIDERIKSRVELPGILMNEGLLTFSTLSRENGFQILTDLTEEELIDGMVVRYNDGAVLYAMDSTIEGKPITEIPGIDPDWFDENRTEPLLVETADGIVSVSNNFAFAIYIKIGAAEGEKNRIVWLFVLGSIFTVVLTSIVIIFSFHSVISVRINDLLNVLRRVTGGELKARVEGSISADEIGNLQSHVNSMASQLQHTIETLEDQVAERTRRLEIVATLAEQLNAILDPGDLLREVVKQTKQNFDYYHTHIYLLDDSGENLVVAAGTGNAGAEMTAKGHQIPLKADSLVARAARSGEIVMVNDVQTAEDWLPNPLLPDTRAEMAVPIIQENKIIGVLDVQDDKIGGLDESDANLLRSLAAHVSVAVTNAHLFAQVETALSKAEVAQKRYIAQAWEASRISPQNRGRQYTRSGMPEPDENTWQQAKRVALNQDVPGTLPLNDDQIEGTAVVAPITIGGQKIGVFQLVKPKVDGEEVHWQEQDLAFVSAILDQIALTAENLRLFEETRERAGRETTIREITDKLRAAPNIDTLLETAARELGARLGVKHTVLELGIEASALPDSNGKEGTVDP